MAPNKQRTIFGLYGAGGFAREVMPFAREDITLLCQANGESGADIYFVETTPSATEVNGIPVLSESDFFALPAAKKFFNIAIADSKTRRALAERCIHHGIAPVSLKAASTAIYDHNIIGDGAILCAHTTITSNARIGAFFHANIYSYVAHDCVIGDYVTFAPNVHCNGNIHIGDHAYIGTGAILRHGLPGKPLIIGEGAVVGMGAVVTKDVAPFTTVLGNPARVVEA